jgi:hypothetical protein
LNEIYYYFSTEAIVKLFVYYNTQGNRSEELEKIKGAWHEITCKRDSKTKRNFLFSSSKERQLTPLENTMKDMMDANLRDGTPSTGYGSASSESEGEKPGLF